MKFLKTIRGLATTYQAFESLSSKHIRTLGLSPTQFDVIATLGNTQGMTCGELGEKTLITKGTLTGVLDRLTEKQLLDRKINAEDGRSVLVKLTNKGQKLFEEIFPQHIAYLSPIFENFTEADHKNLEQALKKLKQLFQDVEK
jgi:MarR family transcriptional regulator, 2-MHQ and catechol-resistance regulon repressor